MKAYGIELRGRKEGTWRQWEFFLFAALCENFGVLRFVDHVYCCHNAGTQVIELTKEAARQPDAVAAIAFAAMSTMDSFMLDGEMGWRERNLA